MINDALSVFGTDSINYTIGFRVTVLDPLLRVKDNSLFLTDAGLLGADAGMTITEWIGTTPGSNDLGSKHVEFSRVGGNLTNVLSDSAAFAPLSEIWVTKHINVWVFDEGESDDTFDPTEDAHAELRGFTQRFSQEPVPEPVTAGLAAMGLAALALAATRRRIA